MYESGDYGGMDDMFAAGEDEDQVNGFLITSSASTYGPASKDNNDSSTDALRTYAEMIFESRSIYFARVDERCWVMEGVSKDLPQLGQFYHVTLYEGATSTGVEKMASCDCSQGKDGHNCLHKQVLLQHSDRFKEEIILSKDINPVAIEIAVHLHGRRAWFSVLSTQSSIQSHSQDGKRCIVSLLGSRRWTCSAPHCSSKLQPASTCVHRQRAEDFWINTIGLDAQGDGGEEDNEVDDADDLETITYDAVSVQAHVQLKPCSHRPVPPPPFCRLPSEPISAPVVAAAALPAVLPIGMHARCDCGQFSNLDEPRKRRSCTIYYSTGPVMRQIETQECKCRKGSEKRSIGPDLSEYGLFNWNNSVVVTHELFNSYSSQLSASSTPLTAFYTTTQHAYEQHCPDGRPKFLARSSFIKLYFAYVGLQQLDVSFSCSRCGPTPAIVIADGVVLAYSASLKHGNLSPPTTVGTERSNRARPQSISPFIPNALVRSAARAVAQAIDHGSADRLEALRVFTSALDSASSKFPLAITLWTRNFKQVLLDVCLASSLEPRLKSSLQHLIVQFSASDGILQLCRPLCKPLLMELSEIEISASTKQRCIHLSTTLSRHCPFLGNLLVIFAHRPLEALKTTESLFGSLQLLLGSTAEVVDYQMAILEPRTSPPPSLPLVTTPSIYTQTGTLYGSPQCRSRPFYPRLEEEVGGRSSEKQAIKESEDTSAVQCRKRTQ
ncbi:hypothetical protein CF319_g2728 [Tilletia indica]|nr:hypothetical protein CF319_g2728 [Tilletia indica]